MLIDFRESFAPALNDPEFQREFIAAAYEEEGLEGVRRALLEIAPGLAVLNTLDLDFAIVPKNERNGEKTNALE